MIRKWPAKHVCLVILIAFLLAILPMHADAFAQARDGYLVRGVGKTLFSVVEIPKSIVEDSKKMVFPVGIVTGTVKGAFRTVVGTLGGVLDMAYGAMPYAKYALFFI